MLKLSAGGFWHYFHFDHVVEENLHDAPETNSKTVLNCLNHLKVNVFNKVSKGAVAASLEDCVLKPCNILILTDESHVISDTLSDNKAH